MSIDPTESARRTLCAELARDAGVRESLEARYGQVWDTDELQRDFAVTGFGAPFVLVVRKDDGARGSLMFQASPRFYFSFQQD